MSHYALRLPESLKEAARRLAAQDGSTMSQLFVTAIAEKISALETAAFLNGGPLQPILPEHNKPGTR